MKNSKYIILSLIVILTISCSNCPEEAIIDHVKTPPHVEKSKLTYQVDSMTFVSENNETITFVQTKNRDNEVVRVMNNMVPCNNNQNDIVNILFDKEESEYEFNSSNADIIKVRYAPLIYTIIDSYDQKQLDGLNPTYRIWISINLPEFNTEISYSGIAMWEDQETIDVFEKQLNEPYSFAGAHYENVSYWSEEVLSEIPQFYYIEDYEIIGFVDSRTIKWIKI